MRTTNWYGGIGAMVLLLAVGCAPANHDEATDGDLSNDPLAPTPLEFNAGKNTISGTTTTSSMPPDTRDFITFTVPQHHQLTALRLMKYTELSTGGPGNRGFHAINTGATSFVPGAATRLNFLGGDHVDPVPDGTDLLPALADGMPAGTGFAVPLGPGTYSYVIQQTGPHVSAYTVEFELTVAKP